jgi:predicted PurR-regulated permease PerM
MTFYFLKDWHKILGHVLWLVPPVFHKKLKAFLGEVDSALGNYARGQLLVCSFLAIYYTIGLELVGLKFAPFIGVMTGFLIFIPYLGFLVGLLFSVGICLLISPSWPFILGVLGVYGIGQGLEGLLLTPRLVGGKTGLHPLWILFALFSSGALFGLVGVVFCLPIAAVLRVLASWGLRAYRESVYYKGCDA